MKKIITLAFTGFSLALASCGNDTTSTTSTNTSIDSNKDTRTTMQSTSDQPMNVDSGMKQGDNGMAAQGMSDQDFVTKASSMNVAEVNAHRAAETHAMAADVKMHASHMLRDHMKMGDEMKALAKTKNMQISTDPPADKKQMLDDMNASKKGKEWDAAYIAAQVNDHQEAISLFEAGSKSVKDADLKNLIDKTLPTLRSHLKMVQDAQAKMK